MAALVLIGTVTALVATEPERSVEAEAGHARQKPFARVTEAAFGAFKDFLGHDAGLRHAGLRCAVQVHRCAVGRHDGAVRDRSRIYPQ